MGGAEHAEQAAGERDGTCTNDPIRSASMTPAQVRSSFAAHVRLAGQRDAADMPSPTGTRARGDALADTRVGDAAQLADRRVEAREQDLRRAGSSRGLLDDRAIDRLGSSDAATACTPG